MLDFLLCRQEKECDKANWLQLIWKKKKVKKGLRFLNNISLVRWKRIRRMQRVFPLLEWGHAVRENFSSKCALERRTTCKDTLLDSHLLRISHDWRKQEKLYTGICNVVRNTFKVWPLVFTDHAAMHRLWWKSTTLGKWWRWENDHFIP